MAASAGSRLAPPTILQDSLQWTRTMTMWAREAHQGHLANTGSVTLDVSASSTEVVDSRVGAYSCICFMPTTLNAAEALASTYVSSRSAEGFTISHANTSTADRTLVYCILG